MNRFQSSEFFVANQAAVLSTLKPHQRDSFCRLLFVFDAFPDELIQAIILESDEFEALFRFVLESSSEGLGLILLGRLFELIGPLNERLLQLCYSNPDLLLRKVSHLRLVKSYQCSLSPDEFQRLLEAFLVSPHDPKAGAVLGDLLGSSFVFEYSSAIRSHLASIVGSFFGLSEEEFLIIIRCARQSSRFAADLANELLQFDFPDDGLLHARLDRVLGICDVIEDADVRNSQISQVATLFSEDDRYLQGMERIPLLDHLSSLLNGETFALHSIWSMILFSQILELPTIENASVEDFVKAYVRNLSFEELVPQFQGFADDLRVADVNRLKRAINFLSLIFAAKEDAKEFFKSQFLLPENVGMIWPEFTICTSP